MTNDDALILIAEARKRAASNFKEFVLYNKQDYTFKWFHRLICEKLTEFSKGNIKKLMIFMPPQHGKSELSTRLFPAYQLGVKPDTKMVVASYNATLAMRFNRDIQRVIDTAEYASIFPETKLNGSNLVTVSTTTLRNSEIFEIVGKAGFCKTVGRGGALTGTPIDVGIIDDPLKDRAEAMSSTIRESLWSWYQDVFETRLHNDSQQILIQTRWHEQDLAGLLLARDDDWEIICLEAIKEEQRLYDPRALGEALWEEKHSLERLLKVKETSPLTFNSLYQQTPKPLDEVGLLWSRNMIEKSRTKTHPFLKQTIVAIDPATTANANSDETGIVVVGKCENDKFYVLDDLSGRYSPQEWAKVAAQAFRNYDCSFYVAEKNQGGDMVKAVLANEDKNNLIRLVTATKGKYTRAEPIYQLYEQHQVFHVGSLPILENQMVSFNPDSNAKSPDRVDALVWGLTELNKNKTTKIRRSGVFN